MKEILNAFKDFSLKSIFKLFKNLLTLNPYVLCKQSFKMSINPYIVFVLKENITYIHFKYRLLNIPICLKKIYENLHKKKTITGRGK